MVGGALLVGLVVIVLLVLVAGGSDDDDGERTDTTTEAVAAGPREADPAAGFEICKDFVEDELRSPSTASFRNLYEDDGEVQTAVDGAEVTIVSTVDSENGFGAELRTAFTCTVRDVGDDRWQLVDLQIDG